MLAQRHAASAAGARAPLARNATTRRATTRRGALVVRAQEISASVDKPLGLTLKAVSYTHLTLPTILLV